MKIFEAWIKGTTPLLQHRFGEAAQQATSAQTRRVAIVQETPREAAERVSYRERDHDGALYAPGAAIARLLREAGSAHKQRGSRKSIKYIIPAAVLVLDDCVPLFSEHHGERVTTFEVDSRPVAIPATKGRIIRHRPRLDQWAARVHLRINEEILPADIIHQLLVEGGQRIGIGDYRPEKGGPFGTFSVVSWEQLADCRVPAA